jgi:hypothetical protein
MKYLVFILIIALCSCKGKKVLEKELSLFPVKGENRIYLVNSISIKKNGGQVHLCTLLQLERKGDKNIVNIYSSFYDTRDTAFAFGTAYSEDVFINDKQNFPLNFILHPGDSVNYEKSLSIDRKRIKLACNMTDDPVRKGEAIKFRMNHKGRQQYHFLPMDVKYGIKNLHEVISSRLKMTGGIEKNNNSIFIGFIPQPEKLTNLKPGHSLVWLDLLLENKYPFSVLFEISENKTEIIAFRVTHRNCYSIEMPESSVESDYSGKAYDLSFLLKVGGIGEEWLVQPKDYSQELPLKKSSFWMGAVEVRDNKTKAVIGTGNMYNFSNKTSD